MGKKKYIKHEKSHCFGIICDISLWCKLIIDNNMAKRFHISNSTELAEFRGDNCNNCYKEKRCSILRGVLVLGFEPPSQWVYDEGKIPYSYCRAICMAFSPCKPKGNKDKDKDKDKDLFKLL